MSKMRLLPSRQESLILVLVTTPVLFTLWYYREQYGLEIQKLEGDHHQNHSHFWNITANSWTGRYDPNTKLLSVAVPPRTPNDWEETLEHVILPKLRDKFNFEHYHVFKW